MDPLTRGGDAVPGDIVCSPAEPVGETELAVHHQTTRTNAGHRAFHDTFRLGSNDWGLVVGDVHGPVDDLHRRIDQLGCTMRADAARASAPSVILGELHRQLTAGDPAAAGGETCSIGLARIELHASGASLALSVAGLHRPIVVRCAGWVDVLGHVSVPLGMPDAAPADDRVGLGAGDTLVLCSEAMTTSLNADGERFGDQVLADVLVDCVGQSPNAVAGRILAAAREFGGDRLHDDGLALVLRVPEAVRDDGPQWFSRSTGIPVDRLRPPGHGPGGEQPGRSGERPVPPRDAIVRMAPEPPSVPALRRLLRRILQSWRMDALSAGDIELLVTEMATNAFMRTASPVTVVVRYTGPAVRVEVGDGARGLPRRRRPGFDDLNGHRLALVESLASAWGVSATAAGTRMWFEVPVG